MTSQLLKVSTVEAFEDGDGSKCWVVEVNTTDRQRLFHNGPAGYSHFTKEQADRLVSKIAVKGQIDSQHWWDGRVATSATCPVLAMEEAMHERLTG